VSRERWARLAGTLLYEGYALYPYRASALKNRKRFDFGVVFPEGWAGATGSDARSMRTECVLRTTEPDGDVRLGVCFLHLVERTEGDGAPWYEAVEREVDVPCGPIATQGPDSQTTRFAFHGAETYEGTVRRRREGLEGRVDVTVERDAPDVVRLAVEITNTSSSSGDPRDEDREAALLRAFVSTHTFVEVRGAELVSLLDPPEALRPSVERCRNVGTWPVLVGEPWERSTMLSSPIILYDHPLLAPESRGELFDATEIDEILTLRAQTLTDDERREASTGDARVRALLERTAGMGEDDLAQLHGVMRRRPPSFQAGDRVRLAPRRRADVMDIALSGRVATVVSVEQDFEGRTYISVTVDDDPGADLGALGQPGHRFFFHAEEVERVP
jgi:hypothetical protein